MKRRDRSWPTWLRLAGLGLLAGALVVVALYVALRWVAGHAPP